MMNNSSNIRFHVNGDCNMMTRRSHKHAIGGKETTILFVGVGSPLSNFYNTSILIDRNILLDAPPGIDKKLKDLNQQLNCIDYVFISHFHGDHTLGLPQLLLNVRMLERTRKLYIIGPRGIEEFVNSILELSFSGEEKDIIEKSRATFIPISKKTASIEFNSLGCEAYRLYHGSETNYGYLMHVSGKAIGYTGDTGPCKNLEILIQKSDMIILDMTFEKTTEDHLGIDYVNKISLKYVDRFFFAVHRGKEIENVAMQPKGVILPMDGDIYEL